MKLAKGSGLIKPSPTLAITAKANALKAEGRDIIGFGAGEPGLRHAGFTSRNAGIRAIESGFTKYNAGGRNGELKDAVIGKLERENGLSLPPEGKSSCPAERRKPVQHCPGPFRGGGRGHRAGALLGFLPRHRRPSPALRRRGHPFDPGGGRFQDDAEALKGASPRTTRAVVVNRPPRNPTGAT